MAYVGRKQPTKKMLPTRGGPKQGSPARPVDRNPNKPGLGYGAGGRFGGGQGGQGGQSYLDPREWEGGFGGGGPRGSQQPQKSRGRPRPGRSIPQTRGIPQVSQPATPFAGGYNQGSTMDQIARNEYLNTLAVGGPREAAMNQMGYFNQGTPYIPQRITPDQGWMNQSMENLSPGSIYQLMGQGGYNGILTGGMGQDTSYQSLGGGRKRRPGQSPPIMY